MNSVQEPVRESLFFFTKSNFRDMRPPASILWRTAQVIEGYRLFRPRRHWRTLKNELKGVDLSAEDYTACLSNLRSLASQAATRSSTSHSRVGSQRPLASSLNLCACFWRPRTCYSGNRDPAVITFNS